MHETYLHLFSDNKRDDQMYWSNALSLFNGDNKYYFNIDDIFRQPIYKQAISDLDYFDFRDIYYSVKQYEECLVF